MIPVDHYLHAVLQLRNHFLWDHGQIWCWLICAVQHPSWEWIPDVPKQRIFLWNQPIVWTWHFAFFVQFSNFSLSLKGNFIITCFILDGLFISSKNSTSCIVLQHPLRKFQRHAKLFCLHSWWCSSSKFSSSKQQQSKADFLLHSIYWQLLHQFSCLAFRKLLQKEQAVVSFLFYCVFKHSNKWKILQWISFENWVFSWLID